MSIAENIKKLRLNANMTQEELAAKIDVSRTYVVQMERGSKIPSLALSVAISEVLKCTLNDLVA